MQASNPVPGSAPNYAAAAPAEQMREAGLSATPPAAPAAHNAPPITNHTVGLSDCETELNGQLANRIVWKALACGLIADGFAWEQGVGLNLAVYLILILFAAASVLKLRMGVVPTASTRLLQLGGVFSLFLIFRDAEELQFLNVVAYLSCLVLAIGVARPTPLLSVVSARVRNVVATAILSGIDTVIGGFLLLFDFTSRTRGKKRDAMLRVARVAVLSVGVSLVFGMLLAAGDPVFKSATQWLVNWNAGSLGTHLTAIALFAWPVAGLLWGNTAFQRTSPSPAMQVFPSVTLRSVDIVGALTALNVLFGVFVATQARVLFGGQAYVLSTTGLSLADYARSGFFTLIVVAGLILSLLLAFNALLDKPGLSASKIMQRLSYSLLSLTSVVLVSAATRMVVYMNAFGSSPDRVFAMAVIGGLALVMAWFAVTVLRNRPVHFAFGALAIAWSTLIVFNLANPHALVARNHLARAARGELYDMQLVMTGLSADVVPVVVAAAVREMQPVKTATTADLTVLSSGSRAPACAALGPMAAHLTSANGEHPWSVWNFSRWRAARALASPAVVARPCP